MATAVLRTLLADNPPSSIPINSLTLTVRSRKSMARVKSTFSQLSSLSGVSIQYAYDNVPAARDADVVVLACKPYQIQALLGAMGMRDALEAKLVISLVAGVSEEGIMAALGWDKSEGDNDGKSQVIRVCPNVGAMVGESMTVIAEPLSSSDSTIRRERYMPWVEHLFSLVGRTMILPTVQFNVAVVLVGAAIALTTVAVDGLLDGSVAEGIPRAQALEMVGQCLLGTGRMLGAGRKTASQEDGSSEETVTGLHPAVLREKVSSPRGCTIQALLEVERRGVRSAMADGVVKGVHHLKGMGKDQD